MPLQVASLVDASGIPYIEKLAKAAVAVIEQLEKKGENKSDVKELCESNTNTVVDIRTLIGTHGKRAASYREGRISHEHSRDLKDLQGKQHGLIGFLNVNKFQEAL